MKLSTQNHMLSLAKKLDCFGCFNISYIVIKNNGDCCILSSMDHRPAHIEAFDFSNRFSHFLRMLHCGESKFFSERSALFDKSPIKNDKYYVALVKKTPTQKIKIYIFHAEQRMEVVRLLLHKEVMKRMALFLDENIHLYKPPGFFSSYEKLFNYAENALNPLCEKSGYLQEVFKALLTKKEREVVDAFLYFQSINKVTSQVNFSASYVRQLLLSAAHKLGLSKVKDILALDKTNGVLLKIGDGHEKRCC